MASAAVAAMVGMRAVRAARAGNRDLMLFMANLRLSTELAELRWPLWN
jgi:hypothetical protein